MMEITDRIIQAEIVGFVGAFSLACIVVGQTNLAGYAIMTLAGALSMAKVAEKQTETAQTQATEDTPSDLSTEDLVKEVDNSASTTDTTVPIATVKETLKGTLTDAERQSIINDAIAQIKLQTRTADNAEPTVITQ